MRNSGEALLRLVLQHKGVKTRNRILCLLAELGQAGPLNAVRVGVGPEVGPER